MDHLEDNAELYALGLLDSADREAADAHALTCDPCAARLGRAEAAVAALADATLAHDPAPAALRGAPLPAVPLRGSGSQRAWPSPLRWAAAAAAAFAIAAGSLAVHTLALQSDLAADGRVYDALIHSHFLHAQFITPAGTPIAAKVVYDRHGGWYEVLATGIDPATRVAIVRGGVATVVARPFAARGDVLTLDLPRPGAVDELRLIDPQGRPLAHVLPVLTADPR